MDNKIRSTRPTVAFSATIPETLDLLAFCRVVDLGSVTAAAKALGDTKGTISRRVSRLEAQLGTPLLRREGRGVTPTEEGRLYRDKAGAALAALEEAAESVRAAESAPSGHLRVTAVQGLGPLLFASILPGFLAEFPGISVEVLLTDAVLSFREHQVDVALRMSRGLTDSSLVAHPLLEVSPVLVASPDYAARRGLPATPDELDQHDTLVVPTSSGGQRMTFLPPDGGPPVERMVRGRVLSHDVMLLHDLARSGAGITGVLPHLADADVAAGRLVRVLPDWPMRSGARLYLLHVGGAISPKVRAFRDHVKARVRDLAACPD